MSTPTPRSPDTATRMLDIAERLAQTRGFNGFSYSDIAAELGIAKASLHHHFATKADLGRALMQRYSEGFEAALGGIDAGPEDAYGKLSRYAGLYEDVLANDRLCLCGMLAAEFSTLPQEMRAQVRRFFEKYQDRILFGTDAVPQGHQTPQQIFGDELYSIYYRFLETEDEYFDYAPAPVPPQGRWRIYGLGLPEGILKKVYWDNAARLLGIA